MLNLFYKIMKVHLHILLFHNTEMVHIVDILQGNKYLKSQSHDFLMNWKLKGYGNQGPDSI